MKEIRLYELTGKQVRSISCNSSIQELDISTLSPGLYFLDAISDQRTFRKRFVKN
ncbi:MAG: T9SS type A sorting domain-containing protein [Bacteroidetes bacterium]|nr:T9SS type A sorting domain-containing protein [Bacteroidota bacterium]